VSRVAQTCLTPKTDFNLFHKTLRGTSWGVKRRGRRSSFKHERGNATKVNRRRITGEGLAAVMKRRGEGTVKKGRRGEIINLAEASLSRGKKRGGGSFVEFCATLAPRQPEGRKEPAEKRSVKTGDKIDGTTFMCQKRIPVHLAFSRPEEKRKGSDQENEREKEELKENANKFEGAS